MWFPYGLRREPGVSGQIVNQRMDSKVQERPCSFPRSAPRHSCHQPGTLPARILAVRVASFDSRRETDPLGLVLVLTFVLLIYAYRVLGTTPWLRRLGWVAPRGKGFWLYGVVAGGVASAAVGIVPTIPSVTRPRSTANVLLLASSVRPNSWRRCSFEACSFG